MSPDYLKRVWAQIRKALSGFTFVSPHSPLRPLRPLRLKAVQPQDAGDQRRFEQSTQWSRLNLDLKHHSRQPSCSSCCQGAMHNGHGI